MGVLRKLYVSLFWVLTVFAVSVPTGFAVVGLHDRHVVKRDFECYVAEGRTLAEPNHRVVWDAPPTDAEILRAQYDREWEDVPDPARGKTRTLSAAEVKAIGLPRPKELLELRERKAQAVAAGWTPRTFSTDPSGETVAEMAAREKCSIGKWYGGEEVQATQAWYSGRPIDQMNLSLFAASFWSFAPLALLVGLRRWVLWLAKPDGITHG